MAIWPQMAAADVREMVARMTLIPQGPGGGLEGAPVYDTAQVPPASFSVFLDNSLAGMDIEDYLGIRTGLAAARYAVWLYRFDTESADGGNGLPSPTLVISPNNEGQFPLAEPAIAAGKTYAWQVVATIEDSHGVRIDLWSTLLYFKTAPAESQLPALLSTEARRAGEQLTALAAWQRRCQAGMQAVLRGLRLYSNYPSASDMYYCTPLTGTMTCPAPECAEPSYLSLAQLIALGGVMSETLALKREFDRSEPPPEALTGLGERVYTLVNQWPEAAVTPLAPRVSTMAAVAEKLNGQNGGLERDAALATLNELLLAADKLVGTGTGVPNAGYEQAFTAYAAATAERLRQLEQQADDLAVVLGADESRAWIEYFREQRDQLEELADEVERGRLSKAQLSARLAELALAAPSGGSEELRYLLPDTCRVNLESIKRLTAADAEQVQRLSVEVVSCQLMRFAGFIWPNAT